MIIACSRAVIVNDILNQILCIWILPTFFSCTNLESLKWYFKVSWTVYLAIIGVFALMGGIIFYASLDNDELAQIEIELTNVELLNVNTVNNQAKFEVTFLVTNPSDKTLTVSQIDFQLYGDSKLLGFWIIFYSRRSITG